MLQIYKHISGTAGPVFNALLAARARKGMELPARISERRGVAVLPRPSSPLVWIHAASLGEAQSALILVTRLLEKDPDIHILMTTGTVSSANMMQKNLPPGVIHQFYPLDHPDWTRSFLDHWQPDLVLWMESELWPNMLSEMKSRKIPAILVNARLSDRSFKRWSWIRHFAGEILSAFNLIIAQTSEDAARFKALGGLSVTASGNLKYSAKPLPFDESELQKLDAAIAGRPLWVYASCHKGEEALACRVHTILKNIFPDLLTILVPRHPDRRNEIAEICKNHGLSFALRGTDKTPPPHDTDIYIADTFGELGLFYRLAPLAVIGRSFSDDGGGGHNPIEAAQLNCAVLYGPHVQYQKELYAGMSGAGAALPVRNEQELTAAVRDLLSTPEKCAALQRSGFEFVRTQGTVADLVVSALHPWLEKPHKKIAATS
jgi:3-deoxy-D-manno-octulosonic-acid transferase